jgi:hypothetical protein
VDHSDSDDCFDHCWFISYLDLVRKFDLVLCMQMHAQRDFFVSLLPYYHHLNTMSVTGQACRRTEGFVSSPYIMLPSILDSVSVDDGMHQMSLFPLFVIFKTDLLIRY